MKTSVVKKNLALEKMYSAGKQRRDGKRYSIFPVK